MRRFQAGIAPIIIIVVVVVLGAGAVAGAYMIRTGRSRPEGSAASSGRVRPVPTLVPAPTVEPQAKKPIKTPKPTDDPKVTGPVKQESGTTANGWSYAGFRDVVVEVRAGVDKDRVYVDFERKNFNNIEEIYFNLNYKDSAGKLHGVEGTFDPANKTASEKTDGNLFIREEVVLGTCSRGVCTYHSGVNTLKLIVKTTRQGSGATYQQTLTKTVL